MLKNISLLNVFQIMLLNFVIVQYLYSQPPDILWTKTIGGSGGDNGYSVQQSYDGGYIITGYTSSFGAGGSDVWLVKTDALGDTLWTNTFGGNDDDYGFSVQQTSDSGYIITGITSSFGAGEYDVWLIKTNALGDTLWTKTFGGSDYDQGNSVQQTSDGGYILEGTTSSFGSGRSDFWHIKTDSLGDTLWTKTFGGSDWDDGLSVQQTIDGGYILVGNTSSFGANDVWLIKTDGLGDTLWTKTFGGSDFDVGYSVQQTIDGGYIITGITSSFGAGEQDVWLIKTDALGDTLWTKTFGGIYSDQGSSVQQTIDGGYIVTGNTRSFGAGNMDAWLIKTDGLGDTLWTKTFGGSDYDQGHSVKQTIDGGYIMTGITSSFSTGGWDVWLIKIAPDPINIVRNNNINVPINYVLNQNYPNPFNSTTAIGYRLSAVSDVELSVYNQIGQRVATLVTERQNAGVYSVEWDANLFSSGVYYYKIRAGSFQDVKKMIIIK